jgi:hypothetical protein
MADQLLIISTMDPAIPVLPNLIWSAAAILILAIAVVALVILARSKKIVGAAKVVWAIVILALPVVGALAFAVAEATAPMRASRAEDLVHNTN